MRVPLIQEMQYHTWRSPNKKTLLEFYCQRLEFLHRATFGIYIYLQQKLNTTLWCFITSTFLADQHAEILSKNIYGSKRKPKEFSHYPWQILRFFLNVHPLHSVLYRRNKKICTYSALRPSFLWQAPAFGWQLLSAFEFCSWSVH